MPLLGLALGHRVAGTLGSHANWVAGALLAATGILTIVTSWKPLPWMVSGISHFGIGRLLVSACASSIDNLMQRGHAMERAPNRTANQRIGSLGRAGRCQPITGSSVESESPLVTPLHFHSALGVQRGPWEFAP